MMFFAFGNLIYISVLLVNAIAILSEDRFLARVGWSNSVAEPAFGTGSAGDASIKSKLINLMTSVRTLMRSTFAPFLAFFALQVCGG
ncbi:related to YOS1, subunit of the Yip1p-Yif1p Complex, required for Transport between the ER and the Golgi Complex [Rhynchosporium secalis]|uniref:Related to YOS1, subunit of the Yip1p-Yif1p Complex, required for Transport between the ER and the Golgi Complex n=1 Tax=Rhynchosporium secalis TaxID=38038 RepID=A0A1E1ME13_RHYSE|nr:related to YOS1, subunit of the Yip1p-Yif1p Complex, required for Transport between the ER and the Golgi Complex [Rhynchosporium secalis]